MPCWWSRVRLKSRIEKIGDCLFTISFVSTIEEEIAEKSNGDDLLDTGSSLHSSTFSNYANLMLLAHWKVKLSPIPSLSREMRSFSPIVVLANFVDYWKWKYWILLSQRKRNSIKTQVPMKTNKWVSTFDAHFLIEHEDFCRKWYSIFVMQTKIYSGSPSKESSRCAK